MAKKEEIVDTGSINRQIEDMIKDRVVFLGLVNTGRMLNSIKVVSQTKGFTVNAVDYFFVLDKEHNILAPVFASKEFKSLIAKQATKQIAKSVASDIKNSLKK